MKKLFATMLALAVMNVGAFAGFSLGADLGDYKLILEDYTLNSLNNPFSQVGGMDQEAIGIKMDVTTPISVRYVYEDAAWDHTFGYFTYTAGYGIGTKNALFSTTWNTQNTPTPPNFGDEFLSGILSAGTEIGFYLDYTKTYGVPDSGTWYSRPELNTGEDHAEVQMMFTGTAFLLGFEDQPLDSSDKDYNDTIIMIGTPLPLAGVTFGITSILAGPLAFLRRKKSALS